MNRTFVCSKDLELFQRWPCVKVIQTRWVNRLSCCGGGELVSWKLWNLSQPQCRDSELIKKNPFSPLLCVYSCPVFKTGQDHRLQRFKQINLTKCLLLHSKNEQSYQHLSCIIITDFFLHSWGRISPMFHILLSRKSGTLSKHLKC